MAFTLAMLGHLQPSLRDIVAWGAILLGSAGMAFVGDRFILPSADCSTVPELEYIPKDKEVACIIDRLSQYKGTSHALFADMVECIDRLLCIHTQIATGGITRPSIDDRSCAYMLYSTATKNLGVFYNQCAVMDAESQARVHRLYSQLYTILQRRWQYILSKTTNL